MSDDPIRGAVGVVERGGRVLVIRRAEGIPFGGAWCFPGGALEPGETFAQAVVREMREEVGLLVHAERELWQWRSQDDRLELRWWSVREERELPVSPDDSEVADVAWLTTREIRNLDPLLESNRRFLDEVLAGRILLA